MSNPTRSTNVKENQEKLVNTYSHYITRGLAKLIRDMDFNLFSLKTEPDSYIKTVTTLAYQVNGFAQTYKELCRNFRHRKDLYWMYEVELDFDEYQYLGKNIIKEIEFMFLYCTNKRKGKNVKKLVYVLQEYIDNRKQNYDILKEYLQWLENGNNDEMLFEEHSNFQVSIERTRGFLSNIAEWIQDALNTCDEKRKETKFLIPLGT
jgi:hypothetical protein